MAKKRKDGYVTITFTINGKRYFVYGRTKQEAKEKERLKRQEIADMLYQRSRGLTLDKYFENWIESREGIVTYSTINNLRSNYRAISSAVIDKAGTTFGSLKLVDIERQNIIDLQNALKNTRRENGTKLYKTATINNYIGLVSQILNEALNDRIITWNPAKGVKTLKRTEAKARDTIHRALTVEETQAFFAAAKGSWYYPLYQFLLGSGCRIGEAGALRLSDIHDGKIRISKTLTRDEYGVVCVGSDTKTCSGTRDIPYTQTLRDAIDMQLKLRTIMFGNAISLNDCIFTSKRDTLLNTSSIKCNLERICKKANIQPFAAHAFRDTFATRAIESGMNPKTLQEILGHADFGMTMNLYAHVMENTKTEEMQLVKTWI